LRTDRFTTPTASASTYFLRHWVREASLLERGPAIRKLTLDAAALWGVRDRGVLAPGAFADVNVIDPDRLDLDAPEMLADFPLGARRFTQRARGYDYTLVNGTVEHDELTGARPGRVVTPA